MESVRRAKDLNFEILSDFNKLSDQARAILAITEPSSMTAGRFMQDYKRVTQKIEDMFFAITNFCGFKIGAELSSIDLKGLIARFTTNAEKISLIARFGYGSNDVLRHGDGSVDVSENGKTYLSEKGREAYNEFSKILNDKGTPLLKWEEVDSLEEAVRFFHGIITRAVNLSKFQVENIKNSLFFTEEKNTHIKILDITKNGVSESEIGKIIFNETLNKLGVFSNAIFFNKERGDIISVIGEDFVDFTVATGKHYIEMSAQMYQDRPEYTISFRYVESGYQGAIDRQDFSTEVLEKLGFRIIRDRGERGTLCATFISEDHNKWRDVLSTTLRLSAAIQDLDLQQIIEGYPELFKNGVVSLFREFISIRGSILNKEITRKIKDDVRIVMYCGSDFEKRYLACLLNESLHTSFNKDIKPYLSDLDDNQLDDLLFTFVDMEMEAKAQGDKKAQARLRRISDKISEMIK